jgi:hypothetical protein
MANIISYNWALDPDPVPIGLSSILRDPVVVVARVGASDERSTEVGYHKDTNTNVEIHQWAYFS